MFKDVKSKAKRIRRKEMMEHVIKIILIRIQIFVLSLGGLWWIVGFDLAEQNQLIFVPTGMLCILMMIYALVPYPYKHELDKDNFD